MEKGEDIPAKSVLDSGTRGWAARVGILYMYFLLFFVNWFVELMKVYNDRNGHTSQVYIPMFSAQEVDNFLSMMLGYMIKG